MNSNERLNTCAAAIITGADVTKKKERKLIRHQTKQNKTKQNKKENKQLIDQNENSVKRRKLDDFIGFFLSAFDDGSFSKFP